MTRLPKRRVGVSRCRQQQDGAERRRCVLYPIIGKKTYNHLPLTMPFILFCLICLNMVLLYQTLILTGI